MTLSIWASGLDRRQESFPLFKYSSLYPRYRHPPYCVFVQKTSWRTSSPGICSMPQQLWIGTFQRVESVPSLTFTDCTFSPKQKLINLVFLTVLHSVALLSTIFRIVQRWSALRLWWDDFLLFLPLGLDATYLATLWVLYHRSCKYFTVFYCYTYRFFYTVAPDEKVIDSFWFTTLLWFLIIWCDNNFLLFQQSDAGPQDMSHQPGLINGQNISSWPPLSTIVFGPCILSCCYVYCVYRHSFSHLPCGEQAHVPRRILHKGCSDGYILCVVLHLKF